MSTIKINGLFGHKNMVIDTSERCIVLIGENGAGKSTIIKIIKALSALDFVELSKYRFSSIEGVDDNNSSFKISYIDLFPNLFRNELSIPIR
jgi:predicted ATP-binding protein involved in virulence